MTPPRSDPGFVRMPDALFEVMLARRLWKDRECVFAGLDLGRAGSFAAKILARMNFGRRAEPIGDLAVIAVTIYARLDDWKRER